MTGYIVSLIVLGLMLLAFFPAIIASRKNYSFTEWYFYAIVFFPMALSDSIKIRKPVRKINVFISGENKSRQKKSYKKLSKKRIIKTTVPHICIIFITKLIFSAFVGLTAYALARLFFADTPVMRGIYIAFSLIFTLLLSYTEIRRLSSFPMLADEITKRALIIMVLSAIASLPMVLLKNVLTAHIDHNCEFIRFLCTIAAFSIFIALLLGMQRRYYSLFSKFFDYGTISILAYIIYASLMLVALSLSKILRSVVYAVAMPLQIFNFRYFENVGYINNLSSIYAAAAVHFVVLLLLTVSGWQCRKYKKKELTYRIEYRTKAFRMSRKRVLRRHISKAGTFVRPLK